MSILFDILLGTYVKEIIKDVDKDLYIRIFITYGFY